MGRVWCLCRFEAGRVVRRGGRLLPRGSGWFWYRDRCGWSCYTFAPFRGLFRCWRGPFKVGDFPRPGDPALKRVPDVKKKVAAASGPGERHLAPVESEILRDFLSIIEHCAVVQYDDGDPRQPGWITVRTQGRAWVADVKDPDSGCSFRLLATTFDELLESLQELLSCDQAPWEPDHYLKSKAKQPRKK